MEHRPPPFPIALHTGWSTRYPISLYATPLRPSPRHCTPGGLHGTPPAFMEHPSPPSPQQCTPGGLHGRPPAFMLHSSPLPHSTAHRVVYTVPHQPLCDTPPPFPTALHTTCTTRYPISLYGTPLPSSPQHCTPGVLHGTPPAFMEHPSPLPHSTAHRVVYTVPHQPLWNTPPPFPTALHTGWSTRYPTSLYGTPLPPSPQHCTPGVLHGTPPAFMEHRSPPSPQHCTPGGLHGTPPAFMKHPSPLPHSTAHRVYYTVPHQPLWNTPPPFPTALHTGWSTRYPTSLYGTSLPPSPQHCTPGVLHGTPPPFMEHPSPLPHSTAHHVVYTVPHHPLWNTPPPLPHSTAHQVYYTVPHQPLWNTPPPFPTALHTRCTTWYPTSLYGTPLPPSPQHCTPCVLHSSPPAFMEHPSPLPHSTAHQVYYTVPHQPLWDTPPPFPTALHTRWSTRYPTTLYGTPLSPSPQHNTPGVLHGTPPAFMKHPSPLSHNIADWVVYTVPHQPLWNTPPPLPRRTTHHVVYTVPHQPLWNTPPPYPTALHTGCTTRYPISLYGTPLPPSPSTAHRVVYMVPHQPLWNTPPPLPHSTAHHVYYTVPHQPLWNTPPPFPTALHTRWSTGTPPAFMEHPSPPSPQNYTPGGLHGTPPAFMQHPSPLPHSTAHQVVYWYPTSLYGTPLPPFPTELHTGWSTRYPTSLYATPLPPSPQLCTLGGLHGTPLAFMEHPSPLPHSTAHQVVYTVPHHPLWNTPPPFPTALHTRWSTRYPTTLYETPLPPSPQHCRPGGLHDTPPAFMEHPSPTSPQNYTPGVLHGTPPTFMEHPSPLPHSTAHYVYYTVPHQPLWNTPPPFPTTLHTGWSTWYPTSLYGTPLPPSPKELHTTCTTRYPTSLYGTPLPPSPTALHTTCTTRYPISLCGTPLPPSPQHCTPGGLHGTPSAFMEHPSPLPHSTAHRVVYTVPHQPLWNTPPPFPTALHTTWSTRYPTSLYGTPLPPFPTELHTRWSTLYSISLYGTPLPPSPQHCTPGGLHGTPPAFMEHPSPLPHSTAHQVVYTVPHQPLWNTPPPLPHRTTHHVYYTVPHQPLWNTPPRFPTALHTTCTTRYPTSLNGTPLPPSPQHCTPGVLHGTPPAFMEHPSPLPHSTAHQVYYTVPHQPLWNTPPPFPTALHTGWSTRYPTSLYGTPLPPFPTALHTGWSTRYPTSLYETPLPPSPQHCTPGVLHGTSPAFMEHSFPLPHSTAHRVVYTVPHQPLWNIPPPFPTALHTGCTTRYPTTLYGTPLRPSPQYCTPGVLHGTPPAFMEHPTPPSPQHCTPGVLHGTPPAFMEHPSPLPHSTAHQVYYMVPHQPLWNTPPPFPTALHTMCTTQYSTSLYGTPLPSSPQHCTLGGLHGTPLAFMEHPSPLPHSTAHHVYYTVLHQPLWNTPPLFPTALHTGWSARYPTTLYGTPLPPSPQHNTPGVLHGTPPAFMKHPSPLPRRTTHQVVYTVPHQPLWNTPPPWPTALHTGCTTRYPISLYGTFLPPSPSTAHRVVYMVPHQPLWNIPPPLPHSTAHHVYYTVPHQPLWNTPPPFPTAPHTGWSTRYPTSLYGTPLPPSPQHCTPGGLLVPHQPLWNTPPPLPHRTTHRVVYTVPHQPLCNTPPPFPTALHTGWSTRYPISLYGTPLPPSPQHCTPGGLHGTPPAFMKHPSPLPHNIADRVVYTIPHQPLWNTPPPLPHSTAHQVVYTVPHHPL